MERRGRVRRAKSETEERCTGATRLKFYLASRGRKEVSTGGPATIDSLELSAHLRSTIDLSDDHRDASRKEIESHFPFLLRFPSICANHKCCCWILYWTISASSLGRDVGKAEV